MKRALVSAWKTIKCDRPKVQEHFVLFCLLSIESLSWKQTHGGIYGKCCLEVKDKQVISFKSIVAVLKITCDTVRGNMGSLKLGQSLSQTAISWLTDGHCVTFWSRYQWWEATKRVKRKVKEKNKSTLGWTKWHHAKVERHFFSNKISESAFEICWMLLGDSGLQRCEGLEFRLQSGWSPPIWNAEKLS